MTGIPPFFDCFYVFMVQLLIGKYTVLSDSLIKRAILVVLIVARLWPKWKS